MTNCEKSNYQYQAIRSMNINVCIIGSPSFASEFGKKGTESDITLYNYRKDEDTITFVHPSRYPDRLSSLLYSLELADMVIMEISTIDAALGEVILAIHSYNVNKGYIYLKNYLQKDQLLPLLNGTKLQFFQFTDMPPPELKELIIKESHLDETEPGTSQYSTNRAFQSKNDEPIISIDHFFNVRGIGPVVLGIVRNGIVNKHHKLELHPTGKQVLVRSIQTHDKDVVTAGIKDRVGLALKGIDSDDLGRGMVLATPKSGIVVAEEFQLELELVPYWKKPVEAGLLVHLVCFMQSRPARITEISTVDNKNLMNENQDILSRKLKITVKTDVPFVYHPDARIFVSYLEGGNLRIMGTAHVIGP